MTVRARLLLTLGGIILLMVVPAAYGVSQLSRLEGLAVDLEVDHARTILELGQMRASFAEFDRVLRGHIADPNDVYREAIQSELGRLRSSLDVLTASLSVETTSQLAGVVDTLQQATVHVENLLATGRAAQATNYFQADIKALIESARVALGGVGDVIDARGRQAVDVAREVSASASRTATFAALIALLLTLGLGLWTVDALSRPLRRLSDATGRVAEGEFDAPANLPYDREDEIGDLSRAFGVMTDKLAELDRLKAEFVSLASHELKTPINVIGGYTELLDEGLYGDLEEKQREVLDLIQEQTKALTRLVNQLLDLSRFEAGGLRVEPKPVDLRKLLGEVEGAFRALAVQKQIDFEVEGGAGLPTEAVLDHDRIRHEVLGNLLSNAFKFTPTGGRIRVEAAGQDGRVTIRVVDSGMGIPEDQLEHIFEKYYQVGDEAKSKGSGLGLAIAKHVVEAHGGTIRASSQLGEGTAFDIELPRQGPE